MVLCSAHWACLNADLHVHCRGSFVLMLSFPVDADAVLPKEHIVYIVLDVHISDLCPGTLVLAL